MSLRKSVFNYKELSQSAIGSFTAVLLYFALRGGDPLSFDPGHGLLITTILIIVYYKGFEMVDKNANFIANLTISFVISALMGVMFGLITTPEIFTYNVFGSAVIVGVWLGFPAALVFDKFDFTNPMRRQYVSKK